MRIFSARSHSTFTRCASPHANCGASRAPGKTPFTSTCGMTILSQPDSTPSPESLAALPPLPRDAEGPVFAAPWQAQAFSIAFKLPELSYFTWKGWAAAFPEELKSAADRGEPDDGSRYYEYWLPGPRKLVNG